MKLGLRLNHNLSVVVTLDIILQLDPERIMQIHQLTNHHEYAQAGHFVSDDRLDHFAFFNTIKNWRVLS